MRQLDMTYHCDFLLGGHIELQVHVDLDALNGEGEYFVTDLVLQALRRKCFADRIADTVNTLIETPSADGRPEHDRDPADSEPLSPQSKPDEKRGVGHAGSARSDRASAVPMIEPEAEAEAEADPEPPFHVEPALDGHRRVFTRAQKLQSVEFAEKVGYSRAGRTLGVHANMIRKWSRALRPGPLVLQTQAGRERRTDNIPAGADRGTQAPSDDPAWPCKCSCGRRFPTVTDWRDHRKGIPQTSWKLHRLVEQPKAGMVDPGIPRQPSTRERNAPDVHIVEPHIDRTFVAIR
jgi:hypothetical protein